MRNGNCKGFGERRSRGSSLGTFTTLARRARRGHSMPMLTIYLTGALVIGAVAIFFYFTYLTSVVHAGKEKEVRGEKGDQLAANSTKRPEAVIHAGKEKAKTTKYEKTTVAVSEFTLKDLNDVVLDFQSSALHSTVSHSSIFVIMADVIPFNVDPQKPLIVSWRERERLRSQLLLEDQSGTNAFPTELLMHVEEDRRWIRSEHAKGLTLIAPQPNPPFDSLMTVDSMRRSVLFFCPPTRDPIFVDALIDLLRSSGVQREPCGSLQCHNSYTLSRPLVIHLPPCSLGVFVRRVLLEDAFLQSSAVNLALEQWNRYSQEMASETPNTTKTPPTVPRRFILTTTDEDATPAAYMIFEDLPSSLSANAFVHSLLDHPLLVHWYAQDCNIKGHPKFSCIPIGINLRGDASWAKKWNEGPILPMFQQFTDMLWTWFQPQQPRGIQERSSSAILGGIHYHPADILKALLQKVGGIESAEFSFSWCKRQSRERVSFNDKNGECKRDSCERVTEDVVEVELLEGVLEKLNPEARVAWVDIERLAVYLRHHHGEGGNLSLRVRLVAPKLRVQSGLHSSPDKSGSCFNNNWEDPASPPLWCQLHTFGVSTGKTNTNLGERTTTVELLIPVPAVLTLALQYHRPIASSQHREMRVACAFDDGAAYRYTLKKFRRGIEDHLLSQLNDTIDVSGKKGKPNFWESAQNNLFVASPPGCGYDCYRTWEAMLLGSIPIILHPSKFNSGDTRSYTEFHTNQSGVDLIHSDSILELFEDLPVVVVKDFNFTVEQLEAWRSEVEDKRRRGLYNWEKLFAQHWLEQIGSHR